MDKQNEGIQGKDPVRRGRLAAVRKVGYQSAIHKINDALVCVPILLKNRTGINQIQ